jgi:hypothetical protein
VATASLVLTVEGIPDGLAIFRDTGPAGFVSYVTGIRCPAPSGGDTMWVVTGGAGGSPSDVAETVYRGGADVAWVSTAHNVSPGSYDAHIDCVDSASGSSSAGGAMVKAYEFTQTITGPASHATVTPSPLVPGAPMTIGDGGGCGSDTHVGQTVTIMVYNLDGGPGFLFTVLPVDGSGHWGPMTLNSPLGPTVSFGVYVTCGASSSGSADQSRYEYPITTVPVA